MEAEEPPIKRNKRGRPKGPCSQREIEQRREAAPLAAKSRSLKGTMASSRNRWVHGRYAKTTLKLLGGKPCKSTCSKYPCVFIEAGKTKPGAPCLDAMDAERIEHVAEVIMAAIESKKEGDVRGMNELAALELAGNIDLLHRLRNEINQREVVLERTLFNRQGDKIGVDLVENPAVDLLLKLSRTLGINLDTFLATPMTRSKIRGELKEAETAATFSRRLMDRLRPSTNNSPPIDIVPIDVENIGDEG